MDNPGAPAPQVPGTVLVHRAERTFPVLPQEVTTRLDPPPRPPEREPFGLARLLVPVLGSFGLVAFALMSHQLVSLVLGITVVAGTLALAIGTQRATSRTRARREAAAHEQYRQRLAAGADRCARAAGVQRAGLAAIHPEPRLLLTSVRDLGALWERRPDHPDFLTVRLGLGPVDALDRLLPPTGGVTPEAELDMLAAAVAASTSPLAGAPVTVPLRGLRCVAVIGPAALTRALVRAWLAEVAAFHAPGEVRVAGLVPAAAQPAWEWAKWLPHTAAAGPSVEGRGRCLVTTDPADFETALVALAAGGSDEHLVVVQDDWGGGAGGRGPTAPGVRELGAAQGRASTVVVLCRDATGIPEECSARVDVGSDGTCRFRESGPQGRSVGGVVPSRLDPADAEELARWLAPRRVGADAAGEDSRGPVRLVDLLEGLPPLVTPIGRQPGGRPLLLDLKEAAHGGDGPHGVLVGATGSGKSELLRSLILGLAVAHSPDELTALLVDFKGGAAFAELAALPHCTGLVTNLADDLALVDRVRLALDGEIEHRQRVVRDAGCSSVAELGALAGPRTLPYLLVAVDEFGELLDAQPEILETLATIGRLGRSLGIHLLLASQRLDEGRLRGLESHLSYRICLRTFTAAESRAVLGTTAAHELPAEPGHGFLKVAAGLTRFRAALSAGAAHPAPSPSVPVRPFRLDSRGVPAGADGIVGSQGSAGGESDLARLTAQLVAAHPSPAAPIWLPPLPDSIDLAALRARTPPTPSAAEPGRAVLPVAVGLLDDPVRRRQPPLVLDPGRHSIAMVGGPQTGRSTFLRTLLHALCAGWPAHAVQAYVIDCAGGGHRPLLELPHVAGVAERTDAGAVTRLLDELGEVLVERASACSATGTTTLAGLCEHPGADDVLPHPLRARLVVLVDGAQMLRAEHPDEERRLTEMAATGGALGVRMVLTAARWFDLRPALLDTVGTRLELRLGEPADSQVGRARAALVRAVPGRGLTADGQSFQLAVPGPAPAVAPSPHRAPRLVTLPARITEREVDGLVARAGRAPDDDVTGHFLLGVAEARARVVRLDLLAPGAHLVVHGDPGSGRTTLLLRAVAWLAARRTDDSAPPVRLHVVDPQRSMARSPALRGVTSYAYDRAGAADLALALHDRLLARLPPPGLSPEDVLGHGWWSGPEEVLVVDDYDLLLGPDGSPLLPLAELLQQSADLGLHVLLARQVSGTVRTAYEPVGQRLRESAPTGLLLSGDRAEGPLIGDHAASRQPPGRGVLVRPGRPTALVQTCLPDT